MAQTIPSSEFHRRTDLPDWRLLRDRIEATYRAGNFGEAAEFVRQISAVAVAAGTHLDIDLRHPGAVHVLLPAQASSGFGTAEVELAQTISTIASGAGLATEPSAGMAVEVGIDALDIDAVRPFWKAVLDYVDEPAKTEGGQVIAIVDPLRIGPAFWFQQMDRPRPQRNRIHIDVTVPHDVADQRVAAAIEAGGRLLTDQYARSFWVLADPEGNEACVCTWQDRG